jgi:hypothetical protein
MVVKIKFRYPQLISHYEFGIFDFGFWIGGIALLYPLIKQAEYFKFINLRIVHYRYEILSHTKWIYDKRDNIYMVLKPN